LSAETKAIASLCQIVGINYSTIIKSVEDSTVSDSSIMSWCENEGIQTKKRKYGRESVNDNALNT
jgi:hypothetical protein